MLILTIMTEQNVESQDGVEGEVQDANIDYYDLL